MWLCKPKAVKFESPGFGEHFPTHCPATSPWSSGTPVYHGSFGRSAGSSWCPCFRGSAACDLSDLSPAQIKIQLIANYPPPVIMMNWRICWRRGFPGQLQSAPGQSTPHPRADLAPCRDQVNWFKPIFVHKISSNLDEFLNLPGKFAQKNCRNLGLSEGKHCVELGHLAKHQQDAKA